MSRVSWHLESFAWWTLLTGLFAVYCVVVTIIAIAGLFKESEQ